MINKQFKNVPVEVADVIDTGIFWINYTHVTTDISRLGIEKTGKIMSPSIAFGYDIVPLTGEFLWFTYLFKHYHVSVSLYPPGEHEWGNYLGSVIWTPELSIKWVAELKQIRQNILEKKLDLQDFLNPDGKVQPLMAIGECILLEERRNEAYEQMSEEERKQLGNQKHDIYVFDHRLDCLLQRQVVYRNMRVEHPFAPGEIKLERYLVGMFTNRDISETARWISNITERAVPVASIDALATWEDIYPRLPIVQGFLNHRLFYEKLRKNDSIKDIVIRETKIYSKKSSFK